MTALEKLVGLYSAKPTSAIEKGNGDLLLKCFGVADYQSLLKIEGYQKDFALVSSCALYVDQFSIKWTEQASQVVESIRLLRSMLDDGEPQSRIDTVRQLIEGRLYRRAWDSAHQAQYDKKKGILDWKDFFLSYTNRDAPSTNQQLRDLVKSCLGKNPPSDPKSPNFVARVLAHHLQGYHTLSGFFDQSSIKAGEDIPDKVDDYCQSCFGFVQLVEPIMFGREPPKNWCFHEYRQFTDAPLVRDLLAGKSRHYFILIQKELKDVLPAGGGAAAYKQWLEHMSRLRHVSLAGHKNESLRQEMKEVAEQILKLRAEVVEAWLAL
jgi:hypothetical protein